MACRIDHQAEVRIRNLFSGLGTSITFRVDS